MNKNSPQPPSLTIKVIRKKRKIKIRNFIELWHVFVLHVVVVIFVRSYPQFQKCELIACCRHVLLQENPFIKTFRGGGGLGINNFVLHILFFIFHQIRSCLIFFNFNCYSAFFGQVAYPAFSFLLINPVLYCRSHMWYQYFKVTTKICQVLTKYLSNISLIRNFHLNLNIATYGNTYSQIDTVSAEVTLHLMRCGANTFFIQLLYLIEYNLHLREIC